MQPTWGSDEGAPCGGPRRAVRPGGRSTPGQPQVVPPRHHLWCVSLVLGLGLLLSSLGPVSSGKWAFPLVLSLGSVTLCVFAHFEHVFSVIPLCVLQNTYSPIHVEIR